MEQLAIEGRHSVNGGKVGLSRMTSCQNDMLLLSEKTLLEKSLGYLGMYDTSLDIVSNLAFKRDGPLSTCIIPR